MAALVQMLRPLAGLPHLVMGLYPAPQETYSALGAIQPTTCELLCEELLLRRDAELHHPQGLLQALQEVKDQSIMSEMVCLSGRTRKEKSSPVRLLDLARWTLLKHQDLAISSLETLPSELFPQLFLDAFHFSCTETLKAMAQNLEAVMDGLDVLLAQEVRSRRCKLQVLDFRLIGDLFWHQWCGTPVRRSSEGIAPRPVKSSRKGHTSARLEIVIDLTVSVGRLHKVIAYVLNWVKERKDVHLCCRKIMFFHMPIPDLCLSTIELSCVQEVEADLSWKTSILELFATVLGQMKNLQRLILCTEVPSHICFEVLRSQWRYATQLSNQFLQLHSLRELCLDSTTFLKGHLDKVLRCLRSPLEILSLTECSLLERDMTHLCQCANLTQLKELSLEGTYLSLVREPLRVLLENCASTLQDLDLGMCRLRDSHLEAILPALKLCSQLRILNLRGNRVSMATLVQMLRHLTGLPHLTLEVYPAPQESYSARNTFHQRSFDLVCAELSGVLRDLGKPRLILVSPVPCSCHGKTVLHNCEPTMFPVSCYRCQTQKISFPSLEREQSYPVSI
ncbi:PRAME family member 12-like [Sorex araneus]|uniref:PRAME family member 12-like n=1 Tax=Sorex araneus TaxID=42254 RepID=UPI0024336CAC|nr:PRAME family member 12-like [Sorex araneus]